MALDLTLKKDAFKCSNVAEKAFSKLKKAMTQAPMLALPNSSRVQLEAILMPLPTLAKLSRGEN